MPEAPQTSEGLLREFRARLAPYQYNAAHPRSFSYFTPPALALSIAGEVLAQWTNQGVDVWHAGPSAAFVEEEVVSWLADLVGMGSGGFGVLTSGGVMANFMALALMRDQHLGERRGPRPRGRSLEGVRVYASDQAHFSIARALGLLGFPDETLSILPSDQDFRLTGDAVATAVARDRAAGLLPLGIAAVAGTTNTGSVDRLQELGPVAAREGLWFHVDAAYGGAARLTERDAPRVAGLEAADSVTIDPHKWFFQAYDIGGLVVKRRGDLPGTFHHDPEYYRSSLPESQPLNWYQYSFEGTRRFRALKLWLSWKHLGTAGLGRLVEANNDLARHLAHRLEETPGFEVVPRRPELSVVCFRHVGSGSAEGEGRDRDQDRLQRALEVSGEAWVSTTRLRGRTYLRAGVMNYFSTKEDVDRTVEALARLAADPGAPRR
jgi:aromatic-L-amino-acid decarboxylase